MEEFKYLIPEESGDAISLDARKLRLIEGSLRKIFDAHNYEELMLPTFEYVDFYASIRDQAEDSMFQFVNSDGKRIALRTDFTLPIARIYNNERTNEVKRYSYFGKVYRLAKRHKGRSSELYQIGTELIGLGGKAGDQECLSLIEETMASLDLKDLKIELGSAKFYLRLMELVKDDRLSGILEKKQLSEMKRFIKEKGITGSLGRLLENLPTAFGSYEELMAFKDYVKDFELLDAIDRMAALYEGSAHKKDIIFDLCMVPSQPYYTGVMIKGYSYYSAYPILSGGRYDKLLSYFDNEVPAIGFSYHINTLLNAYVKEGEADD